VKPTVFRVLCGCVVCFSTIVPIPSASAAPPVVSEDVPVPGGIVAFTQLASIDPAPDRGRFMSEITRILLQNDPQRSPEILAARLKARAGTVGSQQSSGASRQPPAADLVPVPLTAGWWSDHVFHRRVPKDELVAAIASDRTAALLCFGLASMDDETLAFFDDHGSLVSRLVEKLAAPAFAVFSSGVRVRGGRVAVVPEEAAPLWEAAVLEKVSRPERFLELFYVASEGRLAYLFDTVAQLDPARRAFVLGLWIPDAAQRTERFRLLATTGISVFREWHLRTMPFGRASYDLGMLLARVEATSSGAPASPWPRGFWTRAIAGHDGPEPEESLPIDALWLVDTIGATDVRQRGERQDQFAFAQRLGRRVTIASDRDRADVQLAIRNFPRVRMLLVTLERIGVRRPAVYAAAVRQAQHLMAFDARRGFVAQAQFQGVLSLVARAAAVRAIDAAAAETLVETLAAVPVTDEGRYSGGIAAWLRESFLHAVPRAQDADSAVIAALAGGPSADSARAVAVTWEGQQYRLDLGASERQRLRDVRERQDAIPLDLVLGVHAAARHLTGDATAAAAAATQLADAADRLPHRVREREAENLAVGVPPGPDPPEALKKDLDELTKAAKAKDTKRVARLADAIVDLADDMLASSLLSFAYAIHVGDPDGTVLLADDVSRRHDFGLGIRDGDVRQKTAWATPREEILPTQPWHVTGSLLGLDIALAPLSLRRVSLEGVLEAPRLIAPEREAFALSVSLMNPYVLRDADRDAIADAIARGTRRVQAMDTRTVDAIADELSLDGSRRRALRWTVAHDAPRAASMLSLSELLVLGGAHPDAFASWGPAASGPFGCICTELTTPARWAPMARRPQLGLTASVVADVNLHVAVMLKQLQLPAALARVVAAAAVQDLIDSVKPTDPGDWLTLVRAARSTPRERMEDYVAAATATGPLIPLGAAQQ
jgi:hypothetical protein